MNWWGELCVCLHTAYNYLAAALHGLNHSCHTHIVLFNEHVNHLAPHFAAYESVCDCEKFD